MGELQTDSVSSHQNWVTKARAKGWASGKEADAGRLSKKRGFMLPYLPVTVSWGRTRPSREHKLPLEKAQGFGCSWGGETTDRHWELYVQQWLLGQEMPSAYLSVSLRNSLCKKCVEGALERAVKFLAKLHLLFCFFFWFLCFKTRSLYTVGLEIAA